MRLMLSLPVLVVVLAMVLEEPVDARPDFSQDLQKFGSALEEKIRTAIDHIKESDFPRKTRNWFSETYSKVKEKLKSTFS